MGENSDGSITKGILWMFFISLLLFWLPLFGPFLAGIIGGKKSGNLINALIAVFLPGIAASFLIFMFSTAIGLPIIGLVSGMGWFIFSLFNIGPMLCGAIIGGMKLI